MSSYQNLVSEDPAESNYLESDESSDFEQLSDLARRVIRYARAAKVQYYRYCRPRERQVRFFSLLEALISLQNEIDQAEKQPICQAQALYLLARLAAIGDQPPCENDFQQEAALQIITLALLELR